MGFSRRFLIYWRTCPKYKDLSNTDLIKAITDSVVGFEIHPLAAFVAKTNYMLALDGMMADVARPITIPIYLCDSLIFQNLNNRRQDTEDKLTINLDGQSIDIPMIPSVSDVKFDELIDYIRKLIDQPPNNRPSPDVVESALTKRVSEILQVGTDEFETLLESVVSIAAFLSQKSTSSEILTWSFVIKNNFRPAFFRKKFDLIVGNPPWLSFQYVKSEDYRKELEFLGLKKYKIAPTQAKLRANMELATIFLAHAIHAYLKEDGDLYFVLPRSVFSSDTHHIFRDQLYDLNMNIDEFWDLKGVTPLFRVPSCVLHASAGALIRKREFSGLEIIGRLPAQNIPLNIAERHLRESTKKLYLARLNNRTALSTEAVAARDIDPYYIDKFKKGATIFPRNYYFVDSDVEIGNREVIAVKSSEVVRKNAKPPYKDVVLSGMVNREFLFTTLLAENLLPFAVINPFTVHLPIFESDGVWSFFDSSKMLEAGFTDSAEWIQKVEKSYTELSENRMTYFERINYHNGLFMQNPRSQFWVLYATSGKHVCSAVYENSALFWAEHKTYWHCPASREEAYYLAGVLNSPSINKLIKPFQSMGLLGERDINKKILDVGIPSFSSSNTQMSQISNLAIEVSNGVYASLGDFNASAIGKKRTQVREKYSRLFAEIDDLVISLFQD